MHHQSKVVILFVSAIIPQHTFLKKHLSEGKEYSNNLVLVAILCTADFLHIFQRIEV
jgi:hypothetical protein